MIRKAKFKGGGMIVETEEMLEFDMDDRYRRHEVITAAHPTHPDLERCYDALKFHLAFLCEQVDRDALNLLYEVFAKKHHYDDGYMFIHDEMLLPFEVRGFSIGGEDEHEGVVIFGYRTVEGGKVVNLVAPFTKWMNEHDEYRYADNLGEIIAAAGNEVRLWLDGKIRPPFAPDQDGQTNIFEGNPGAVGGIKVDSKGKIQDKPDVDEGAPF